MKTILYTKFGVSISDYKINDFVNNIFSDDDDEVVRVSTHIVIDEIRARIREKRVKLSDVKFWIEDDELFVDEDGGISNWFEVQNTHLNILNRIFGL